MKLSRISILATLPFLLLNIYAVFNNLSWIANLVGLLIFIPLLFGFYKRLDWSNINLVAFISVSFTASIFNFFSDDSFIYLVVMFFNMVSYFFLYKEALNFTIRETGNKLMLFFFFLLILANVYFLFTHLQEIEMRLQGMVEFSFYGIYYINLLILAIIGLIYYLNSYSRKSVFFITLVMALIFADVFRDMAQFYFSVTSVLLCESILRFFSVILALQFFVTREKKLRLINLV